MCIWSLSIIRRSSVLRIGVRKRWHPHSTSPPILYVYCSPHSFGERQQVIYMYKMAVHPWRWTYMFTLLMMGPAGNDSGRRLWSRGVAGSVGCIPTSNGQRSFSLYCSPQDGTVCTLWPAWDQAVWKMLTSVRSKAKAENARVNFRLNVTVNPFFQFWVIFTIFYKTRTFKMRCIFCSLCLFTTPTK